MQMLAEDGHVIQRSVGVGRQAGELRTQNHSHKQQSADQQWTPISLRLQLFTSFFSSLLSL